ncbi:MAG: PBP1A family penicillin-binding protein [Bacillota bacterium]
MLVLFVGFLGGALGLVLLVAASPLPEPDVPAATRVLDVQGRLIGELFVERRIPVPLGELPLVLRQAVVAVEDERFYRHVGIDPVAIFRAALVNLRARRIVEGASTISMQLVKNLYLSPDRTYHRKFMEAILTLKLERKFTKDEILGQYLNQIYLGHGTFGVEAAAQAYFRKSARQLDLAESALIAGIIRSPENYSPYNNPDAALRRRGLVLRLMVEQGMISEAHAQAAADQPLGVAGLPPGRAAPYFIAHVLASIRENYPAIAPDIFRGGFVVRTTLDLDMQRAAEAAVARQLGPGTPDRDGILQPQVALVAVDPTNGHIRAMVGGRDFRQTQLNRAVQSRRQPGSAFKVFVYTAVIAQGYPATSFQTCEPVSFPGAVAGAPYTPKDFGGGYHNRPMSVREAITISDNVVAVKWTHLLGAHTVAEYARRMGIESPLHTNLSLALGTAEVTPLEMTAALLPLANGGLRVQPTAILEITDGYGNVLARSNSTPRPVLDPRVAAVVTDLFQSVLWPGGTGSHLRTTVGRDAAGKTGTSADLLDAWFVGYTPNLAATVWVGWDRREESLPGTGGRIAGPVWAEFIRDALAGLPARSFQRPAGVIELEVCAETGLLPNVTCPLKREVFVEGTQPRVYHRSFHLPRRTGGEEDGELPVDESEPEDAEGGQDLLNWLFGD